MVAIQRDDQSPASSCISSDEEDNQVINSSKSPRGGEPMVLVGCQRCLMYMMLANDEPKCPKCKGSELLEFGGHGGFRLTNRRMNKYR
uniref:GIR1-like zinc ribbon domain-containing protein n=1 Tax=Kalanchoe fedtschenkoi TaxID=63787 RepID=A0A7N0UMU5_KALFE